MCEIVGISKELVKEKQEESGGAQYIIRGVNHDFFDKVEKDSERLFKEINILNAEKKKADPTHHELQIWAADMWAILWNAWLLGYSTKIIPEMDFCWATDDISQWDKKCIFHNAGVTHSSKNEFFYKADFRFNHPYNHECETYFKDFASYKYFQLIKSVGNNSCLL